ncbi:MAG: SDR family NAD(P)-dependent oxidoreductase [Cyanobacteria bacterium P01_A01_bin.84]
MNVLIIGANRGIGLGFVKKLLSLNTYTNIYATYRQKNTAVELTTLETQHPDKLTLLSIDITEEKQISHAIASIGEKTDKLHLVINCVGFLHDENQQPEKSLRHITSENLLRYFEINSIGSVLLAKHLLPLFKHQSRSVFASISAKVGSIGDNRLGGWYGYRASKAALNMFMHNVAIEYGRTSRNTIVVVLHPGTTDTGLSQPFQRNVPPEKLFPVERTVNQLLTVIDNLESTDSGEFFSWDGTRLPW